MDVLGVWSIESLPTKYVVQLSDWEFKTFDIEPIRKLGDGDFGDYGGVNPRKCHGVPMTNNLYALYGLAKSPNLKSEVMHIRVTPARLKEIHAAAENEKLTLSEFVEKAVGRYLTEIN